MNNITAIYTAIFGGRDEYREPPAGQHDCFLFTDTVVPTNHTKVVHVPFLIRNDPVRTARFFKMMSHVFLAGYKFTLWMDGNLSIRGLNIRVLSHLDNANVVTFKHRHRDCLYSEADFCLGAKNDNSELIKKQVSRYKDEGFPPHAGSFETMALLRRNNREVSDFNNAWWMEIENGSRRDQISLPYVAKKLGMKIGSFGTVEDNPHFVLHEHKS